MAQKVENSKGKILRVILTGPESTGKTALASQLATKYEVNFIPEYARTYIEKLNRPYNYDDVLSIAMKQVEMMNYYSKNNNSILFIDTYLILTKVWFIRVYDRYPDWMDSEIEKTKDDLYLLCKPDIAWIQDGVRENGGVMRDILYRDYENELKKAKLNYVTIEGENIKRFDNASRSVQTFILND